MHQIDSLNSLLRLASYQLVKLLADCYLDFVLCTSGLRITHKYTTL